MDMLQTNIELKLGENRCVKEVFVSLMKKTELNFICRKQVPAYRH